MSPGSENLSSVTLVYQNIGIFCANWNRDFRFFLLVKICVCHKPIL